jgi:hypothetical protein
MRRDCIERYGRPDAGKGGVKVLRECTMYTTYVVYRGISTLSSRISSTHTALCALTRLRSRQSLALHHVFRNVRSLWDPARCARRERDFSRWRGPSARQGRRGSSCAPFRHLFLIARREQVVNLQSTECRTMMKTWVEGAGREIWWEDIGLDPSEAQGGASRAT